MGERGGRAGTEGIQGGCSVLDDLADRVLNADLLNRGTRYVAFFRGEIPSGVGKELLDELVLKYSERHEYRRTRSAVRKVIPRRKRILGMS